ncbi:Acetylornithine aminotransferase [Legionella pneumophila]|nr:Acetylornithine aminotransferase [Legionella pneumophila]
MIGIELDRPANDMRVLGLENQVLFNITAETVVRLLPPLIISEDEIDELVNRITRTINQFTNQ